MPLLRQPVSPSQDLLRRVVLMELQAMVPTGFQWFDEGAIEENSEEAVGQILAGLATLLTDWILEIQVLRFGTNLQNASGVLLDAIGVSYGIERLPGEVNDDLYATRIQTELLIKRITKPNILAGLLQIIPSAELFEPWRSLAIPSGNWIPSTHFYPPSHDFWRAGTFEARLFGTSGNDVSALGDFFEVMKAAGVLYWVANHIPLSPIDYFDDPMIPPQPVPLLPNGIPDPRVPARPNLVVAASMDLVTEMFPNPAPTAILPSSLFAIPSSNNFVPSGPSASGFFELQLVCDMFFHQGAMFFSGSLVPAAVLDPTSPNYAAIVTAGYEVASYEDEDLLNNRLLVEDLPVSEAAQTSVVTVDDTEELLGTTLYSDLQGPTLIEQLP